VGNKYPWVLTIRRGFYLRISVSASIFVIPKLDLRPESTRVDQGPVSTQLDLHSRLIRLNIQLRLTRLNLRLGRLGLTFIVDWLCSTFVEWQWSEKEWNFNFLFLVNFIFYYISYLKYLLEISQFQFPFNFLVQLTHFISRISNLSKKWITLLHCLIKTTLILFDLIFLVKMKKKTNQEARNVTPKKEKKTKESLKVKIILKGLILIIYCSRS